MERTKNSPQLSYSLNSKSKSAAYSFHSFATSSFFLNNLLSQSNLQTSTLQQQPQNKTSNDLSTPIHNIRITIKQ
jgi:hypothetical protein